jgi:hypothetical protein
MHFYYPTPIYCCSLMQFVFESGWMPQFLFSSSFFLLSSLLDFRFRRLPPAAAAAVVAVTG